MSQIAVTGRQNTGIVAILPTTIDEIWRVARMAVVGRMAPKSLVEGKDPDEATSACAIAIMAGAELGLTPLMSLRSYAVINGRPALWGDGLKAVVRQSGRCEYIRTGSDQAMGWCEAKRSDTGEVKRVEFTLEQAKRANLTTKTGPWKEGYADVMMERRATNRCLNDLFADVLGGIVDAQEAMDDGPFGEPRDVTTTAQVTRSGPPPVPDEPEPLDVPEFVQQVIDMVAGAADEQSLIVAWEGMAADTLLADHDDALTEVYDARNARLATFQPEADEGGEQQTDGEDQAEIFPLDRK